MRFLSVGSHLCTRASFRQSLAGLPLPCTSGYPDDIGSSHRGLSPHKLMPMSGVHPSLHPTRYSGLRPLPRAGELKRWTSRGTESRKAQRLVVSKMNPHLGIFALALNFACGVCLISPLSSYAAESGQRVVRVGLISPLSPSTGPRGVDGFSQ